MANHVSFSINFHKINDAAKAKLDQLYKQVDTNVQVDGEGTFKDLLQATENQSNDWDWQIENVGTKWCNLTDWDNDSIHGYSAWDAPVEGLQRLLNILSVEDPNMITTFTYEDEMPNFIGAYVYEGNDLIDGAQDDSDEIRGTVIYLSEDLTHDDYDEDECEWSSQEKEDIFYDELWEAVNQRQQELIDEGLMACQ